MIRTRPALEQCVDARTLLVVTVERLLELLAELGEAGIQSVYHLCGAQMADEFRARLIRLSTLKVSPSSVVRQESFIALQLAVSGTGRAACRST